MAVTLGTATGVGKEPSAPVFVDKVTVTMDASYPTGGEVLGLATKFPGKTILAVVPTGPASDGRLAAMDLGNDKLKMFEYDYDALADGGAIETPNATDLTGVTVEILVISN